MNDLFDSLDQASRRVLSAIVDRDLKVDLVEGRFSLMCITRTDAGCTYVATLVVETEGGLRVPLNHRFTISEDNRLNVDQLVSDMLRTITALALDPEHERVHADLVKAIEDAYGAARTNGIPLSRILLVARDVPFSADELSIRYELTSRMLGVKHDDRVFTMRISDAADFRRCFYEEVLPEQRARAAGASGKSVPEAVND
ncbi:MAG TPA: hypothetical protein VIP11_23380 [Gemmatimonadaceae bacterium]|jgi:hypothetical protein